ncbi:MAG: hypothetical protein ABW003_11410 [Microvirga sp.]
MEISLDVLRDELAFREAPRDLLVDLREFAPFLSDEFLNVKNAVAIDLSSADEGIGPQCRVIAANAIHERRMEMVEDYELAIRKALACDLALLTIAFLRTLSRRH